VEAVQQLVKEYKGWAKLPPSLAEPVVGMQYGCIYSGQIGPLGNTKN
jgi:hypothetical protein